MSRVARTGTSFAVVATIAFTLGSAGVGFAMPRSADQLAHARFEALVPGGTKQIAVDTTPRPEPPHAQTDTTTEPDIALDPNNPNDIVAVYQEGRFRNAAAADIGFSTSLDGGTTWTDGNMPDLTQAVGGEWERASDPAVAWGPAHVVYVSSLVASFHAGVSGMAVQRSTDGGRTWSDPVTVQRDPINEVFNDKDWIAADTNPSSPHVGRIYVAWDRFEGPNQPIVLRYSDDQGTSWSSLIPVPGSKGIGVIPLVEPNGDVVMVWDDFGMGRDFEVSAVSKNGGRTWSALTTIERFGGSGPPDMRTGGLPSAAVDPKSGVLYVVWQDARFRGDGTNDIVMSRSVDEGATWRPIAVVNHDPPDSGIDHFTPAVAAWGPNVSVTYRTRSVEDGIYSEFVGMGYTRSSDNGASFGPEHQLGPRTDIEWASRAIGKFLGDYMAIAVWKDVAHPVWCAAFRPEHRLSKWHQTTWSSTVARP